MTATRYRVVHRTSYRYSAPMTDGYTVACLVPRPTPWQAVIEASVALDPSPSEWDSFLDPFGNLIHQFGLHEAHDAVTVEAVSIVERTEAPAPVDDTPWEDVVAAADRALGDQALDVRFFRSSSTFVDVAGLGPQLREIAAPAFVPGRGIVDAVTALCDDIHATFEFDATFSDVSTPLADVLIARRGVCQDFAHLATGCLRALGLPARYVSGYIETDSPPDMPRLVGADASHAWCAAWTPLAGWVDFDPTNGHLPTNRHVTVAWGRDYADVTPVRGVMIGPVAEQWLEVSVDVAPC
jgi:transglutaminase-like putative cysteine protease